VTLGALATLALAGCDLGTPEPESATGPPVHVIAVYPPDGAGEDCGTDPAEDCGVPTNGPIELRFDRYLLPKSVSRASIVMFSGAKENGIFLAPSYDVLERVVTFTPSYGGRLLPGVVYQVELPLPEENPSGDGFRAFDGAPLEKGPVPLEWSFRTSRISDPTVPAGKPPSCEQAVETLAGAGCSAASCHISGASAPMGLSLKTTRDLRETAIARVAHESGPSGTPTTALENPPRFGTAMPIIDPGSPETSFLVYKLFENPRNFGSDGGCSGSLHKVPMPAGTCLLAPPAERARLAGWFVDGDSMPPGNGGLSGGIADLRSLLRFIDDGTNQCR
jgi:hypothetical protein